MPTRMDDQVDVIQLSSSPSASPVPGRRITRSQSRERPSSFKGKGVVRPQPATRRKHLVIPEEVINVESDSEGELTRSPRVLHRSPSRHGSGAVAGPSKPARTSSNTSFALAPLDHNIDGNSSIQEIRRQSQISTPSNHSQDTVKDRPSQKEIAIIPPRPPQEVDDVHPENEAKVAKNDEKRDPESAEVANVLPEPAPELSPLDVMVAKILEIIPDVQPSHVLKLIDENYTAHGDQVDQIILHHLFENPNYPKIEKPGAKRKRSSDDEGKGKEKIAKVDYASSNRQCLGGEHYVQLAMAQLMSDYPYIPKPYITQTFFQSNQLYVPTHFKLEADQKTVPLPYKHKTQPSRITGKAKVLVDPEFEQERAWLVGKLANDSVAKDEELADQINEAEYEDSGEGIECGCCFAEYAFDKMVQCPDGHLFCKTCARRNAEEVVGNRKTDILCMDMNGCKLPFPETEMARFLSEKTLYLWHRIKAEKDVEQAGIEGLESCPFCPYSVVIENEAEKLFRCENEDCRAITCRKCKKADHLPKSCKEMEEDSHLDARHKIEEAMTEALMRKCPRCDKAFIKEHGCNKMTCPNCQTLSCYVCRQIITGYEHFGQPPPYTNLADPNKCQLWDSVEKRHHEEVAAAAKVALDKLRAENPDVPDDKLQVDLPAAPPPQPAGPAHAHMAHAYAQPIIHRAPLRGPVVANYAQQLELQRQQLQAAQAAINQQMEAQRIQATARLEANRVRAEQAHLERIRRAEVVRGRKRRAF